MERLKVGTIKVSNFDVAGKHMQPARTWIKRLRGVRAIFVTTISCGGRELAEVESTWVCLDSATKLPKALEPDVTRLFL